MIVLTIILLINSPCTEYTAYDITNAYDLQENTIRTYWCVCCIRSGTRPFDEGQVRRADEGQAGRADVRCDLLFASNNPHPSQHNKKQKTRWLDKSNHHVLLYHVLLYSCTYRLLIEPTYYSMWISKLPRTLGI